MRIDVQRYTERFGSVRLNDVQRVLELDSGRGIHLLSLAERIQGFRRPVNQPGRL